MKYDDIVYSKVDDVGIITINRPHVDHAVRSQTCAELIGAFGLVARDETIKVVIFDGREGDVFRSGFRQLTNDDSEKLKMMKQLCQVVRDLPQPVITGIWGLAAAEGLVLASSCDIAIASEHAVFHHSTSGIDSLESGKMMSAWARVAGMGGVCTASEAHLMGLVNAVVPHERVADEVLIRCADVSDGPSLRIWKRRAPAGDDSRKPFESSSRNCVMKGEYAVKDRPTSICLARRRNR